MRYYLIDIQLDGKSLKPTLGKPVGFKEDYITYRVKQDSWYVDSEEELDDLNFVLSDDKSTTFNADFYFTRDAVRNKSFVFGEDKDFVYVTPFDLLHLLDSIDLGVEKISNLFRCLYNIGKSVKFEINENFVRFHEDEGYYNFRFYGDAKDFQHSLMRWLVLRGT